MIAIVDVGLGNVASVRNMAHRLGFEVELRSTPAGLGYEDRYILPGVGAFDEGVSRLRASGWFEHLAQLPADVEVLGICLGMQLLGSSSTEGSKDGLGRVAMHFERFPDTGIRIPHMGWNVVTPTSADRLFDPALEEHRYYFTHSYRAVCDDPNVELASAHYGGDFAAAVISGATRGVQFHPEKSHRFGLSLLGRWLEGPC